MVSIDGNLYSVPNSARRRTVEVHSTANEVRILEDGAVIAVHPVLDGRGQRRTIGRTPEVATAKRSDPTRRSNRCRLRQRRRRAAATGVL
jgi:hypothetical protein